MYTSSTVPHDQHPPPGHSPQALEQPPGYYTIPIAEDPPPSYDDATHSERSPLLVGPPPDYGAYRTYAEPDASSTAASSDQGISTRSLPEWVGQMFVVFCFVFVMYTFYQVASDPYFDGYPGPGF